MQATGPLSNGVGYTSSNPSALAARGTHGDDITGVPSTGAGGSGFVLGATSGIEDDGFLSDATFSRRLEKFETSGARFQVLSLRLAEYRAAMASVAEAGSKLAEAMHVFFRDPSSPVTASSTATGSDARSSSNNGFSGYATGGSVSSAAAASTSNKSPSAVASDPAGIPSAFQSCQQAICTKWEKDLARRYEEDVCKRVQACLDQFPEVRNYIRQRGTAHAELQKRQKKLGREGASARAGRDRQRKWREVSERYKFFDDEVTQRFSYVEREQKQFVLNALRNLVVILNEYTSTMHQTMQQVAKLVAVEAPITREFEPPPRRDGVPASTLASGSSGHAAGQQKHEDEGWDDAFDFDDDFDFSSGKHGLASPHDSTQSARGTSTESTHRPASGGEPGSAGGAKRYGTIHAASPARSTRAEGAAALNFGASPSSKSAPSLAHGNSTTESTAATTAGRPVPGHSSRTMQLATSSASLGHPDASGGIPLGATGGHGTLRDHANTSTGGSTRGRLRTTSEDGIEPTDDDTGSRSDRRAVLMRLMSNFDFSPQETNELELRRGDIIEVYEKDPSGWWVGRANHATGYFPQTYARELTEEEELKFLAERAQRKREKRKGHRRKDSHDSRKSGLSASHISSATHGSNTGHLSRPS